MRNNRLSPLAMAEWIEILLCRIGTNKNIRSPLAMAEWIEISKFNRSTKHK